jgi:hypothetical protein
LKALSELFWLQGRKDQHSAALLALSALVARASLEAALHRPVELKGITFAAVPFLGLSTKTV